MPWQQAAQAQPPRPASPVPEGESVRLAALQATWKRDRTVARRRLWWRWALWGTQRYALPAAAAAGVFAGLWLGTKEAMTWLDAPARSEPVVATAPAESNNPLPPIATSLPSPALSGMLPPQTVVTPSGMALAFEIRLPGPTFRPDRSTQTPVSSAALPDAAETPNPQLISENWLHSKEP